MNSTTLDEVLEAYDAAITAGAQERLRGDQAMVRVAAQRGLSEGDLDSQVLGFWLQAIRTDVALGSVVAMSQNLGWLVRLRAGHDVPFDDTAVTRMFEALCAEIEERLDSPSLRQDFARYRTEVEALIADAFPGTEAVPE